MRADAFRWYVPSSAMGWEGKGGGGPSEVLDLGAEGLGTAALGVQGDLQGPRLRPQLRHLGPLRRRTTTTGAMVRGEGYTIPDPDGDPPPHHLTISVMALNFEPKQN